MVSAGENAKRDDMISDGLLLIRVDLAPSKVLGLIHFEESQEPIGK